jgi:signal transduction histidine kinase
MDKIFNPFFTTNEVGKGTGMGLSVAQTIIANHGGKLEVNSIYGDGATFYFDLPTDLQPINLGLTHKLKI